MGRVSIFVMLALTGCTAKQGACLPYARTAYDVRDHKEKPSAGIVCTGKPLITIE